MYRKDSINTIIGQSCSPYLIARLEFAKCYHALPYIANIYKQLLFIVLVNYDSNIGTVPLFNFTI